MGRINGRASRIEEKELKAFDAGKPEKKKWFPPKQVIVAPKMDLPLTDARRVEHMTRVFDKGAHDRLPYEASAPFVSHKGWPARDEALANTLMARFKHFDIEYLNLFALKVLFEVRRLTRAASPGTDWLRHNQTGVEATNAPYGIGYGVDATHDAGPTVEKIKELWEQGEEPDSEGLVSELGTPWRLNYFVLRNSKSCSGNLVKSLRQVGGLRFNEQGHLCEFRTSQGRWLKFNYRTRSARGNSGEEKRTDEQIHADLVARAKKHNLLASDAPIAKGAELNGGSATPVAALKFDDGRDLGFNFPVLALVESGRKAGGVKEQAQDDPVASSAAVEAAQSAASERLAHFRKVAGPVPYEALEDAAMGMRLDEIGDGPRGNKQASARGRDRVRSAVIAIAESENGREYQPLKLAA